MTKQTPTQLERHTASLANNIKIEAFVFTTVLAVIVSTIVLSKLGHLTTDARWLGLLLFIACWGAGLLLAVSRLLRFAAIRTHLRTLTLQDVRLLLNSRVANNDVKNLAGEEKARREALSDG